MNLSDILNPLKVGFDLIKEWKKQKIIHIHPLNEIEKEDIYKKLTAEGYEFRWFKEYKIEQSKNKDWKIVTVKHKIHKNKIFMDKNEELTLMCRKKT